MSQQGTLIYIEKENITEAEFMSRNFVNKDIKNRAFINTIGAEVVMKYLASEGINVSELYNIHSISKILEDIDIADILLPNIHIDVRTVFDRTQIFVPKSHFELGVTPDVYVVIIPDENFKHVEMIGYFTPQQIDKNNQNDLYYFISDDNLSPISSLTQFVKDYTGKAERQISESDFLRGRELSIQMADHNISLDNKKELIKLLLMSNSLRESVLEFDNFETLAYNTICEAKTLFVDSTKTILPDDTFDLFEQDDNESEQQPQQDEKSTEEEEQTESDVIEDTVELDNSFFDEFETTTVENIEVEDIVFENNDTLNDNIISHNISDDEMFSLLSGDDEEPVAVSDDAMKLAGVAGDSLNNIIEQNIDKQQEHLNMIDSENITLATVDIPENIASLSFSQTSQDNQSDEYDTPTDISSLKTVDNSHLLEEAYEHETIDLSSMAAVETETFSEHTEGIVSFEHLTTNTNSPTKPAENLDELMQVKEEQGIDLPDITTIALDENYDIGMRENVDDLGTFEAPVISMNNVTNGELTTIQESDISEDLFEESQSQEYTDENATEEQSLFEQDSEDEDTVDDTEDLDLSDIDDLGGLDSLEDEELSLDFDDDESLMSTIQEETTPELVDTNIDIEETTSVYEDTISDMAIEDEIIEPSEESKNEEDILMQDFSDSEEELSEAEFDFDDITELPEDIEMSEELDIDLESDKAQSETPVIEVEAPTIDEPQNIIEDTQSEILSENKSTIDEISPETDNLEQMTEIDNNEISDIVDVTDTENVISDDTQSVINVDEQKLPEEELPSQNVAELNDEFSTDLNQDLDMEIPSEHMPSDIEQETMETNEEQQPVQSVEEPYYPQMEPLGLENSRVISDRTFTVGEIPIDINLRNKQIYDEHESIESLYNESGYPGANLLNTPGRTGRVNDSKKGLSLIGTLLVLVLVCGIGFGVAKLFKAPQEETPQPIIDDTVSTSTDNEVASTDTLKVNPDNVVKMDAPKPAPVVSKPKPTSDTTTAKSTTQKVKQNKVPVTSFLEVQKLTWEVPDYVSYNQQFKQYFQSAGKSLKLSLTSDLLLATEPTYSREIKVTITYAADGAFQSSKILKSSGSTQIDNIVLQTVNQTLKVLKAPSSVGNDESTTAILKIYF